MLVHVLRTPLLVLLMAQTLQSVYFQDCLFIYADEMQLIMPNWHSEEHIYFLASTALLHTQLGYLRSYPILRSIGGFLQLPAKQHARNPPCFLHLMGSLRL
jgi:hypothetical protein